MEFLVVYAAIGFFAMIFAVVRHNKEPRSFDILTFFLMEPAGIFAGIFLWPVVLAIDYFDRKSGLREQRERLAQIPPEPDLAPPIDYCDRVGEVISALSPGGRISIDGADLDVVSEGDFIESGSQVRVLRHQAGSWVVRAL